MIRPRTPLALLAAPAAVAALAVAASGASAGLPAVPRPPCRAPSLKASFDVVSGSAGAGHIVYLLRLRNRGPGLCRLTGISRLRLVGRNGAPLPTRAQPAGGRLLIAPGHLVRSTARFSPDIPSFGEPARRCEPVAYRLRMTLRPSGDAVTAAVRPRTRVCGRGHMAMRPLQLR